jgi:hypothetical protein
MKQRKKFEIDNEPGEFIREEERPFPKSRKEIIDRMKSLDIMEEVITERRTVSGRIVTVKNKALSQEVLDSLLSSDFQHAESLIEYIGWCHSLIGPEIARSKNAVSATNKKRSSKADKRRSKIRGLLMENPNPVLRTNILNPLENYIIKKLKLKVSVKTIENDLKQINSERR